METKGFKSLKLPGVQTETRLTRFIRQKNENRKLHTVFKDQAHGGDGLAAHEHDGIVSGGFGEGLGLAVGVEDEAAALVQQLLVVQRDAAPAGQQLLEQRRPVDTWRTAAVRYTEGTQSRT